MKRSITTLLLLIFAFILPGPSVQGQYRWLKAANAVVKGAKALTLTDEDMAEYARESIEAMDKRYAAPASNPYSRRLKRLTAGLREVDKIPLNFRVYKTSDINAFASPDGSVRVFSGLMDIMTDDELLGVIGHEIGHVGKHHSRKAFRNQLLSSAARDALMAKGGKVGALSASLLGDLGESLLNAKFSRNQEREADDYGYDFLKENGKNPWGIVMSFEKLMQSEKKSGKRTSWGKKMFSSHPDTKERIDRLSRRAEKEGLKRPAKGK